MSIIEHKDRFDVLFKISEDNIENLYMIFQFYSQDKDDLINFVAYKTIRILYLNYRQSSGIEQKKFSSYKQDKKCILDDIIIKLKKRVTQLITDTTLIADRQSFNITTQGARQIDIDFKLADVNADNYINFDEFMYLMMADPFRDELAKPAVSISTYNEILKDMLDDKIFKHINVYNYFILEKDIDHISRFELEIAKAVFKRFCLKDIDFSDIKDFAIIININLAKMNNTDRKFYYFYFKKKRVEFDVDKDINHLATLGLFEYLSIVRKIKVERNCIKCKVKLDDDEIEKVIKGLENNHCKICELKAL